MDQTPPSPCASDAVSARVAANVQLGSWERARPALVALGLGDCTPLALGRWLQHEVIGGHVAAAQAVRVVTMYPWRISGAQSGHLALMAGGSVWLMHPVPAIQPTGWRVVAAGRGTGAG
jgi:hypothetical protein